MYNICLGQVPQKNIQYPTLRDHYPPLDTDELRERSDVNYSAIVPGCQEIAIGGERDVGHSAKCRRVLIKLRQA